MDALKKLRSLFDEYESASKAPAGRTLSKRDVSDLLEGQRLSDQETTGAYKLGKSAEEAERKPGAVVTFGEDTVYGKGKSKLSDLEPAQESLADMKRRLLMGGELALKPKPKPAPVKRPAELRLPEDTIKGSADDGEDLVLAEETITVKPKKKSFAREGFQQLLKKIDY
jgi:hypothetical protein